MCSCIAPGFPGQSTPHQYVVSSFSLRHLWHTGCFSRSSSISDGSRPQPTQARLSAAGEGAPPSSAAGGRPSSVADSTPSSAAGWAAAVAALAASLSAFSAASASRSDIRNRWT
eukprot:scaffold122436_cov52-Phaeocystis_antarctica.AAC.2